MTEGTRFADRLPLIGGVAGAIVGLIAARTIPTRDGAGGRFFTLAYPALIAWWILVVERGCFIAMTSLALWVVIVGAVSRVPRRRPAIAAELWKITAAARATGSG